MSTLTQCLLARSNAEFDMGIFFVPQLWNSGISCDRTGAWTFDLDGPKKSVIVCSGLLYILRLLDRLGVDLLFMAGVAKMEVFTPLPSICFWRDSLSLDVQLLLSFHKLFSFTGFHLQFKTSQPRASKITNQSPEMSKAFALVVCLWGLYRKRTRPAEENDNVKHSARRCINAVTSNAKQQF